MDEEQSHMDGAHLERVRIATWLRAKSLETERLLKTAAERCEGDRAAWNKLFSIKARVLIEVLAEMVERDAMALQEVPSDGA